MGARLARDVMAWPNVLPWSVALVGVVALVQVAPASLGICAAAGFGWLILVRPMLLVAGYAAIVFSNAADVATDVHGLPPLGGTIMPLLILILLVRAATGREWLDGALVIALPATIYLFGRAWSLQTVAQPLVRQAAVVDLAKDLLILVVFAGYLTTMARVRMVVAASALAIGLVAGLSVLQYATGSFTATFWGFANAVSRQIVVGASDNWRLTGPLPDANFFGQVLVLGLPLVATFAVVGRSRAVRMLAAAGALLVIAATVFTFSRGALVGLAAVAALAALWLVGRRGLLRIALAAATLAGIGAALAPARYMERLVPVWQAGQAVLTGSQYVNDPALAERLSVVQAALGMFRAHPFAGVGTGQFKTLYAEVALRQGLNPGAPAEAHSLYLETLAEGGLLGLTLFALLVGGAIVLALRARRRLLGAGQREDAALVAGITLSAAGFLVTSIFLHGAYQRFLWLDIALLLSVWAAAQYRPTGGSSACPNPEMNNDR